MAKCSQCEKPAVVEYDGTPLCVEHHLKMQQAIYLQVSRLAANLNYLQEKISAGTGGIIPPTRMEIPPPPFIGDNFTLNNINVSESTIGMINTGTVRNLDASITIMQSRGEGDLAAAVQELTQALVDSREIEESAKKEISEQLELLVTQATAEPKNRSMGLVKSVLAGLKDSISVAAGLITIWDKVEPLIRAALGV